MGVIMRQLLATLTVVGSFTLPLLGCGTEKSCRLVPDPDCDWHVSDSHCMYLCEKNQANDSDENADEQDFYSSESGSSQRSDQNLGEASDTTRHK